MLSNKSEIEKFSKLSNEWWKLNGKFKVLHDINKLRVQYIKQFVEIPRISILDIGCGGGILSESLCKEGGLVTALDPSEENILIARRHAETSELEIEYIHSEIEDFIILNSGKKYDLVCLMEVLEHVDDINSFLEYTISLIKKGGMLVISTINKSLLSYIKAIFLAESILKFVPKNTHDWNKFIKPSEIVKLVKNGKLIDITGLDYSLLSFEWILIKNKVDTNYFMTFQF